MKTENVHTLWVSKTHDFTHKNRPIIESELTLKLHRVYMFHVFLYLYMS